MGGMSSDNIHGLVLALSSSVFIGSSFIIKKKGLMKAGDTGIRAGFCSFLEFCFLSSGFCMLKTRVYGLIWIMIGFLLTSLF